MLFSVRKEKLDAGHSMLESKQLQYLGEAEENMAFLVAFLARIVRQIQENYLKPYINKSKSDRIVG